MKITLVLTTINRTDELEEYFKSLICQSLRDFEVILVDQNTDDRLSPLVRTYLQSFRIEHIRTSPGVSRARFEGLRRASGEIIGFPDDNCLYPKDMLSDVYDLLSSHPEIAGVSKCIVDPAGPEFGRFDAGSGAITKSNIWTRTSASALFVRKSIEQTIDGYDLTLGPGANTPWDGAEDIDYPLQILENGYTLYYSPSIIVHHPSPLRDGHEMATHCAYRYGAGIGQVWRKHEFPIWFVSI